MDGVQASPSSFTFEMRTPRYPKGVHKNEAPPHVHMKSPRRYMHDLIYTTCMINKAVQRSMSHVHMHNIKHIPCWMITSPALAFEVNMASKISLQKDNVTNLYKYTCTSVIVIKYY